MLESLAIKKEAKPKDNEQNSNESTGMDEKTAERISEVFIKDRPAELYFSVDDLNSLLKYTRGTHGLLRDQIFLFQPFMVKRMGLGVILLRADWYLVKITEEIETLLQQHKYDDTQGLIFMGNRNLSRFCELGQLAVKIVQLIWNPEKAIDDEFRIVYAGLE